MYFIEQRIRVNISNSRGDSLRGEGRGKAPASGSIHLFYYFYSQQPGSM